VAKGRGRKPSISDEKVAEIVKSEDPEEDAAFARAMGNVSSSTSIEVAACCEVTRFSRIVDVGGSQGVLLAAPLAAAQATGVLLRPA
jgi:hypothetical protein